MLESISTRLTDEEYALYPVVERKVEGVPNATYVLRDSTSHPFTNARGLRNVSILEIDHFL
jgi:hypothetical protein